MNCKSLFFLVVFSLTLISGVFAQKKVSILGDSYSTFYGHVLSCRQSLLVWSSRRKERE